MNWLCPTLPCAYLLEDLKPICYWFWVNWFKVPYIIKGSISPIRIVGLLVTLLLLMILLALPLLLLLLGDSLAGSIA
jgi:hypothetical protein